MELSPGVKPRGVGDQKSAYVHFVGDVVGPVDAFAEARGDVIYGRDVIDLVDVHGQAASADAP